MDDRRPAHAGHRIRLIGRLVPHDLLSHQSHGLAGTRSQLPDRSFIVTPDPTVAGVRRSLWCAGAGFTSADPSYAAFDVHDRLCRGHRRRPQIRPRRWKARTSARARPAPGSRCSSTGPPGPVPTSTLLNQIDGPAVASQSVQRRLGASRHPVRGRNTFEQSPWRAVGCRARPGHAGRPCNVVRRPTAPTPPRPPSPHRPTGLIASTSTGLLWNPTVTIDHDCHPPRRIVGCRRRSASMRPFHDQH